MWGLSYYLLFFFSSNNYLTVNDGDEKSARRKLVLNLVYKKCIHNLYNVLKHYICSVYTCTTVICNNMKYVFNGNGEEHYDTACNVI